MGDSVYGRKLARITCPRCQKRGQMQPPTDRLQQHTVCGGCQTPFVLMNTDGTLGVRDRAVAS